MTIEDVKRGLLTAVEDFKSASAAHRQAFEETLGTFKTRVSELETGILQRDADATMDALTGLANRGAFDRTVLGLMEMPGAHFTLALLDIDRLRRVNEQHGHLAGDRVLLGVAQALKAAVRDTDLVARYGPDEFAVLMRDLSLRQSESVIYNAVSAITHQRLTADDGRAVLFTISGGLAELEGNDTADQIAARANDALESAKKRGRNEIVAAHPRPTSSTSDFSRLRH